MQAERPAPPPLIMPLLQQTYEIWSLEASWFLFYGFFMLAAAYAAGQVPIAGLALSLALDGPLLGGLVLATRRILLQERPEAQDFMGGFRRALPLAMLSLLISALTLLGLVLAIVPGLIVAALLSVAAPVLLLEGGGLRSCLEVSARLVRPRLWPVVALVVAQAALQVLLALPAMNALLQGQEATLTQALPLFLGLGLLGPFHGILSVVLYQRLRSELDL